MFLVLLELYENKSWINPEVFGNGEQVTRPVILIHRKRDVTPSHPFHAGTASMPPAF